ncbi:ABC transporter permease [Amycolatopsis sp. YIM 10]|uniref:ABC transporter permease n=1 Tax=Amycolatopsis sp. YIM 10 TaxID=2653857 RepID=UPI0012906E45|nr:ABC transporter permease [Amycolatopsis sp. YIM 10]QFU85844.1 Daunorubicin/doxorubicin resistance ABC transporter permease protein DrrB [Amycolatopsis sp. YIM 10]
MTTTSAQATSSQVVDDALLKALATRERPPKPSALSTSFTFGWRALLKIKHVPDQLFDVTAFPIMMTLMFTYLFGGALAGSTDNYLQFFLPGILVQSVVMITMYTGVGINEDISKGIFDRFRSLPIWRPSVIVGALFGDAVRYLLGATITILLGLLLGFRPEGGFVGVVAGVAMLLVFSFSLSWVWTMFGLKLSTSKSVMGWSMMVLMPLTFGSNIYVDPATMPSWLRAVVDINPVTHLVSSVRGLMHGTVAGSDLLWVFGSCAVLIAVFGPITMRLYGRQR